MKSFYSSNPNYFTENIPFHNYPQELLDIVGLLDLVFIFAPLFIAIFDWVYQKEEKEEENDEPSNVVELKSFVVSNKEEEDSINQPNSDNVAVQKPPTKWKKRLMKSGKAIFWLAGICLAFTSWFYRLYIQNIDYITFPEPSYYPHVSSKDNITCTNY